MNLFDSYSIPISFFSQSSTKASFRRLHHYFFGREDCFFFRDYSFSWDFNDPNGLPPSSVILDDYLMVQAMRSALKGDERHARWPVNFMPKGYPDWHLRGTGRAAKVWANGQWEYVTIETEITIFWIEQYRDRD